MKGIVIYDTSSGNTKKIAETIAETLRAAGIEVDLSSAEDMKKLSPTKFGKMKLRCQRFL
jgi:menaquinone-dependent protoporphyrinogen IX oxidase